MMLNTLNPHDRNAVIAFVLVVVLVVMVDYGLERLGRWMESKKL